MKKKLSKAEIEQEALRMRALARAAARRQIRYTRLADALEEVLRVRKHASKD